jgi:type IV pilus assembly protein PilE
MRKNGFSLIEIMVVVLILGILTILAITLYTGKVRQGRRSDGVNTLLSISLAQERYRTINTTYGTLAQVWGGVTTSTQGYYTIAISEVSATGYTLTATAVGDQANDVSGSTACSTLTLTSSSGTVTETPTACWPQ